MDTITNDPRTPIRNILVATDFSDGARAAFDCAIEVAGFHEASISVFHAVDLDESMPPVLEDRIKRDLGDLERIAREVKIDVESEYRLGAPWDVLVDIERESDVDLIIVGTHGHNPWKRMFLGSKADRMIRVASAPVLAVHSDDSKTSYPVNTALVGIDFSRASLLAAEQTARLLGAAPVESRLVLFHAFHCPADYSIAAGGVYAVPVDITEREDDARVRLEAIADTLRTKKFTVEVLPRYGYPVSAIEETAKSLGANLIAVGTHGRSGLRRMFLGSVAERVLHHAPCPVLAVRHPDDVLTSEDAEKSQSIEALSSSA